MVRYVASLFIQRLVYPIVIAICILIRPVALSIPNLILLLWLPFVPVANRQTINGHTGAFLIIGIVTSVLSVIVQIGNQVVMYMMLTPLESCGLTDMLLRHIGMFSLVTLESYLELLWFIPEVVMLLTSIGVYIALRSLSYTELEEQRKVHAQSIEMIAMRKQFGTCLAMLTLLLAAAMRPSVPSALYFIVFLGASTWWACFKELDRAFAIICRIVLAFLMVHFTAYLCYQTPYPQMQFDTNSTLVRFLGFDPLVQSTCHTNKTLTVMIDYNRTVNVDSYLNPLAIILCYYTLAITSGLILNSNIRSLLRNGADPTERTPLMNRGSRKFGSLRHQRATDGTEMSMGEIGRRRTLVPDGEQSEVQPTLFENLVYGMGQVIDLLFKNSYILNNIIMMTWSIVYHSWITFVFLVWANLLWVIPNQRKNMMRCAPFVVFYAEFLLLAQYVYGMNLHEDELPSISDMKGINMAQVGFVRYAEYPCQAILLKTLFTVAFWVTMRQRFYEKEIKQQTSALAHLAAPIQVSVNAATSDLEHSPKDAKSKPFQRLGNILKYLLLQLWIWIVVMVLFLCAAYGHRMTAFRIIYMTLFLSFLICFQLSWRVWAKLMYAFWVVVIGFAMSTLLMIYTYQFDRFNEIWANYIHIPESLQQDIGLEKFQTKDLFLHLVNPTLVVIITVVQLQIFHTKYLAQLDFTSTSSTNEASNMTATSIPEASTAAAPESPTKSQKSKRHFQLADVAQISPKSVGSFFRKSYDRTKWVIEVFWLIVEMHAPKLILILAFYLSVYEVSVLHILISVLAVSACATRSVLQSVLCRLISLFVGLLLIVKMIYQIQYIDHSESFVNCTGNATDNTTANRNDPATNTANWIGLYKSDANHQFIQAISGYVWFIIVTTVYAFLCLWQKRTRYNAGLPVKRPKIIFAGVTREKADENLTKMVQYLFNYGFYKFGVELTLIMMVVLIAHRMDLIALIYVIWLTIIFCMGRRFKMRVWPILKIFMIVLTIVQYLAIVGFPPFLCFNIFSDETPQWEKTYLEPLVVWAFVPDKNLRLQSMKLMMDFLLLMFVCQQLLVFRIEQLSVQNNTPYAGGSNQSVIEDIHQMNSVPEFQSHDFITYVRSWLDIFKCIVFLSSFWVSLAIVFLTGSNRVSLFSVGYLVGSFIFLWQGTEFYLRPIFTIVRWWKHLIRWNLLVIACKVILQVPSCVLISELVELEWLRQLFGMGCIQKYEGNTDALGELDAGLIWDGVCFAMLSFELRIFQSYYFCHIINDSKANTVLASRGAELIEALRRKELKIQAQREADILLKIKQKMDRIKANQRKLQPTVTHPKTHFEGSPAVSPSTSRLSFTSHQRAVRSGDYYLFEDLGEKLDLDMMDDKQPGAVTDDQLKRRMSTRRSLKQVFAEKKRQRLSLLPTDSTLSRRPSLPEEHASGGVDPRSTVSDPMVGGRSNDDDDDGSDSEFKQFDGQKPGPSHTDASSSPPSPPRPLPSSVDGDNESVESKQEIALSGLAFVMAFLSGMVVSATLSLYKLSRNYRYVMRVLTREKIELKSQDDFGRGHRVGTGNIWTPMQSVYRPSIPPPQSGSSSSVESATLPVGDAIPVDADRAAATSDDTGDEHQSGADDTVDQQQSNGGGTLDDITTDDFYSREHSLATEFATAVWYAIMANTDLLCYLMVFINMVASASMLAMPIPIMVFLWGTLTVPRPSKTFWVTLIAYTQVVVLIKCICQLNIVWWHHEIIHNNNPLAPPRIIGIERKEHYAAYDLALLLVIFFHRFIQKQMGIWRSVRQEVLLEGVYDAQIDPPPTDAGNEATIVRQGDLTLTLTRPSNEDLDETDGQMVHVTSDPKETANYFPSVAALSTKKYCSSFTNFFDQLMKPVSRVTVDLYLYIFMCDFINFFVLLFGFTAFGSTQGDGGVASYVEENKIPVAFLIMLLLQFIFIIVDRALYLRKNLTGKIIFQFVTVIAMHIWLFFLVPMFSEKSFNASAPPIIFYIVKCFYFLFSAFQIRCGYPRRILGNCLTKGFSMLNLGAFKLYMATPFLFELRALMDWIWTESSMPLFEWLKMEDIFANIYELKCSRQLELDFPAARGVAKTSMIKYLMGGGFLFIIIAVVWGPLALFALGNTVGTSNIPYDVQVELRIGSYEPVYSMTAHSNKIQGFTEKNWELLKKQYSRNKVALTFLSNFENDDVAAVELGANSTSLWIISPPDLDRLLNELRSNDTVQVRYKYSVSRTTYSEKMLGTISAEPKYELKAGDPARAGLIKMLSMRDDSAPPPPPVVLSNLFPKFLKVKNLGDLKTIPQMFPPTETEFHRNLSIRMYHNNRSDMYWETLEKCDDPFYVNTLSKLPYADCTNSLVLYTVSDKLFPPTLSWLTAGGVIGIYSTFVFLASRFFRGLFSGGSSNIMFSELPYVDRILQLCLDIYLVRESLEFALEEDLFAKLIFLYRSPETMIKWTRPAEEQTDEDATDADDASADEDDEPNNGLRKRATPKNSSEA